jgi:hypothetical protein
MTEADRISRNERRSGLRPTTEAIKPDQNLPKRRAIKDKQQEGLGETELSSLTNEVPVPHQALEKAKLDFYLELRAFKDIGKRDNRAYELSFTQTEAEKITSIFFNKFMGKANANRINALKALFHQKSVNYIDGSTLGRARIASRSASAIPSVQRFFELFSRSIAADHEGSADITLLEMHIGQVTLVEVYEEASKLAKEGDPAMVKFLKDQRFETRKGVGHKDLLHKYFANTLGIRPKALTSAIQACQSVKDLKEEFGWGILPLIPPQVLTT